MERLALVVRRDVVGRARAGDRAGPVDVQPPDGNARLPLEASPDETWMSENTTRPHRMSPGASSGVVNEKYCTDGVPLSVVSA